MPSTRLAALALLLLAVTGCTAQAPDEPTPSESPSATQTILNPELVPQAPSPLTADSAATESTRLADAIQALVDPAMIVAVNDESQLVPADDDIASYYGFYRQLSLADSVDPLQLAETLSAVLHESGWTLGQETAEESVTVWPLSSGPEEAPWFLFIGGGADANGNPALTFTIGSPDIA